MRSVAEEMVARHQRRLFYRRMGHILILKSQAVVRRGAPEGLVTEKKLVRTCFYFELLSAYCDILRREKVDADQKTEET